MSPKIDLQLRFFVFRIIFWDTLLTVEKQQIISFEQYKCFRYYVSVFTSTENVTEYDLRQIRRQFSSGQLFETFEKNEVPLLLFKLPAITLALIVFDDYFKHHLL